MSLRIPIVLQQGIGKGIIGSLKKHFKFPSYKVLFGPTGEEVVKNVNLEGKTCLITGGYSGIGLEITKALLSRECKMVLACRNIYAADMALKQACKKYDYKTKTKLLHTNLASLASVTKAVNQIKKEEKKIDIVMLNAGCFGLPWVLTEDNLETVFQVNSFSQIYLLLSLENLLADDARVVMTSAESHRNLTWTVKDTYNPTIELLSIPREKYTSIKAYNTSKLCGVLFMHYLGHRWRNTRRGVFCAHPGSFVKTKLCNNWWPYELLYTCLAPFTRTPAQAAATPLYCATSPNLAGFSELYFKNLQHQHESDIAHDSYLAFRLYDIYMNLINERVGHNYEPKLDKAKTVSELKLDKAKTKSEPQGFPPIESVLS